MPQPKVSIVVPVYNPGEYFEKCLSTLVNQTLHEIEIILVLDCPTDGSDKVAEGYAAQDSRIKLVYNKQNMHAGLSRNAGLEVATGEYIGFVDSDDYSDVTKYEKLYKKAVAENLDMVCCNYYVIKGNSMQKGSPIEPNANSDFLKNHLIDGFIARKGGYGNNWRWLYRANMIKQHAIRFVNSRVCSGEDGLFSLESYLASEKISVVPEFLCYYIVHQQSISHNIKSSAKDYTSSHSAIALCEHIISILQTNGACAQYQLALLAGIPQYLYSGFYNGFHISFRVGMQGLCLMAGKAAFVKLFATLLRPANLPILFRQKISVIAFVILVLITSKVKFIKR